MLKYLLPLLLVCSLPAVAQQEIAVVVVGESSQVLTLSRDDIAAIYLGNLPSRSSYQSMQPLDLADGDVRDAFYRSVVGRNRNQMRAYWSNRVFTGKGQPPPVVSVAGMWTALRDSGLKIGYLPFNEVQERKGMRVLLTVMMDN